MTVLDRTNSQLALLGGPKVRDKPYPPHQTRLGEREKTLVNSVLETGVLSGFAGKFDHRWAGGEMVRKVEALVCQMYGAKHAVMFNSGTSGMHAALAAVGVEPGDEVIVPGISWTSNGAVALMQGAVPIFCDVDPVTFQMDPAKVEALITPRTKVIYPINLMGMACDLDELRAIADRHGLWLIEDNAHAFGTRYRGRWTGSVGHIGVISLNYHKVIQCGEGGIAVTDDDALALKLRLVRNHGEHVLADMADAPEYNHLGYNYRPNEIDAAISIGQFEQLAELTEIRRELGDYVSARLKNHPFITPPVVPADREMNYYVYGLKYDASVAGVHRNVFCKFINAEGVWLNPGYVRVMYRLPLYREKRAFGPKGFPFVPGISDRDPAAIYAEGACPVAERLLDHELMTLQWLKYPLTKADADELITAVDKVTQHMDEVRGWAAENRS